MAIYYATEECFGGRYKLDGEFQIYDENDLEFIAEQCAGDYWDNHDGYESNWPLSFRIYKEDDSSGLIYESIVEMEMSPDFSASKKK